MNVVVPSGTRTRMARGRPSASRRAISSGDRSQAPAVVVPGAAGGLRGLAARLQLVGIAVAVVAVAACAPAARPSRGSVRAAPTGSTGPNGPPTSGPLVPVEAQPAEALEDAGHHVGRRALDVGVLDAQDERAAGAAGVQPVEERGARAADVQVAGGGRGEPEADGGGGHCRGCRRMSPANPSV